MTAGRSGDGHKRIVILGSTGSIGEQALEMVRAHPDRLTVAALAAGSNAARLADQSVEFGVELLAIADESAAGGLSVDGARVFTGPDGICDLISAAEADLVVGAISGVAGLRPLMVALEGGVDCALANKEPLVAAGGLVIETARKAGAQLLPVDSEISAIFQCMRGERSSEVERILLTASGGPFSRLSEDELQQVTPDRALGGDVRQIEVVIHHQSIIHSMVQFHDGSVMAQMGPPDMRLPIGFALFYPDRVQNDLPRLSLPDVASLTFARPDTQRFPCLRLAISAARAGRSYPVVLNAADEVAVDAFLGGRIPFMRIPELIERALEEHQAFDIDALGDVEEADAWARQYAHSLL